MEGIDAPFVVTLFVELRVGRVDHAAVDRVVSADPRKRDRAAAISGCFRTGFAGRRSAPRPRWRGRDAGRDREWLGLPQRDPPTGSARILGALQQGGRLWRRAGFDTVVLGLSPYGLGSPDENLVIDELAPLTAIYCIAARRFLEAD